jgi:hypothetical protein
MLLLVFFSHLRKRTDFDVSKMCLIPYVFQKEDVQTRYELDQ